MKPIRINLDKVVPALLIVALLAAYGLMTERDLAEVEQSTTKGKTK